MNTLKATLDMVRSLKSSSAIKVNRNFEGFFADRIVQSFAQATLLDSIEHLAKAMDCSIEYVGGKKTSAFMQAVNSEDATAVLSWIRDHPRITAMIAALRNDDDYQDAINTVVIDTSKATNDSTITRQPSYQMPITVELLAPLSHGGDTKAGNATIFRRRQAITGMGRILTLPYYAGNAVRGQMRDLLADHLLRTIGLTPRKDKPPVNIWFFHALYAGGVLEEQNKAMEGINTELGKHGSIRTDGMRRLRDMLPSLSILGSAIGNRIIEGRISVGDMRPACREWGNGIIPAAQLMEWTFLTRRDDYEGKSEEDDHAGMIATTEVLKTGTVLHGGVDVSTHANELEMSALGCGLKLLQERGLLGADNRRGLGKVAISIDNAPDSQLYIDYLTNNQQSIIDYLSEIGATHAPGMLDLESA